MGDIYAGAIEAGFEDVLRRIPAGDGNRPEDVLPVISDDMAKRAMVLSSALFFIFGRWPGTLFVERRAIESHLLETASSRDAVAETIRARPFSRNTAGIYRKFLKAVRQAIWNNMEGGTRVYRDLGDEMQVVSETVPYFSVYFAQKTPTISIEDLASSIYDASQCILDSQTASSAKTRRASLRKAPEVVTAEEERASVASSSSDAYVAADVAVESAESAEEEEDVSVPKKAPPKKRAAVSGAASASAARPAKRVVKVTGSKE